MDNNVSAAIDQLFSQPRPSHADDTFIYRRSIPITTDKKAMLSLQYDKDGTIFKAVFPLRISMDIEWVRWLAQTTIMPYGFVAYELGIKLVIDNSAFIRADALGKTLKLAQLSTASFANDEFAPLGRTIEEIYYGSHCDEELFTMQCSEYTFTVDSDGLSTYAYYNAYDMCRTGLYPLPPLGLGIPEAHLLANAFVRVLQKIQTI